MPPRTKPSAAPTPLLTLTNMTRRFPGVIANERVNLTLARGEIHALLGENGAGKSTLVQMIYGILRPHGGQIAWDGKPVTIANPAVARRLGIGMVFQHFSLFESLSVLENIALALPVCPLPDLEAQIITISNCYGLPLAPRRAVYTLSVGERQRIEIIRCLLQQPKLLIMDEPTSVLTPQEVSKLFSTLTRLADEGVAILYISHKLAEIKALCQSATILRAGKVTARVTVATETTTSLAAHMMGPATPPPKATRPVRGAVHLQVSELNYTSREPSRVGLKQIQMTVHRGEIVGIAGVAGNGQDELLQVLNGEQPTQPPTAIRIADTPCAHLGSNARRLLGLASIPEERLGYGVVPPMSLVDNALLTAFQRLRLTRYGYISYRRARAFCRQIITDFGVKANSCHTQASTLSGGNLQKFIVGRELTQAPSLLIVAQPTWGVDAGAARTIHHALRTLAVREAAIVVISQDLDELLLLSDRIAAICGGALSPFVPTAQTNIKQLGLMMAGARAD